VLKKFWKNLTGRQVNRESFWVSFPKVKFGRLPFTQANSLSGWRAECQRHHEETLDEVRKASEKQVDFNVTGVRDFVPFCSLLGELRLDHMIVSGRI
jgi:hypothetical protein